MACALLEDGCAILGALAAIFGATAKVASASRRNLGIWEKKRDSRREL